MLACASVFATSSAHAQANSCAAVIHGTECMDACPAGFTATTQDRVCVETAHIDGANKCEAKGWTTRLTFNFGLSFSLCDIKTGNLTSTRDVCSFGAGGGGSCVFRFGPDLNFPQRPADDPATAEDESDPRYVYNCDTDGTTGHLPARFVDGRTMCECPAGATENADGVCTCPAQTVPLGEACLPNTPENRCKAAGWTVSADNQCVVPIASPDDGDANGCFLTGNGSPQCADVFGLELSFPSPSTDSAARFVYDCGLDMIPPRANTDGATECAPDPQACAFGDLEFVAHTSTQSRAQISMQFDVCAEKGWQAKKHPDFDSVFRACYCDIKAWDVERHDACPDPVLSSRFSLAGNTALRYYFGPTLEYLPQWTAENADDCFVAYCQDGTEPAGFNTNGATECQTPSGEVCGSLDPPQVYNGFVCVATCSAEATLDEATNTCECNTGNAADCRVPSTEACADFTPPRFYNAGAARCEPFLTCEHPTELRTTSNTCECVSPYVGTPPGCQMPSPAVCGELSGPQFFDGTTCVAGNRCPATTHANTESRRCECNDRGKVYDAAAQACVAAISCAAPATLSAETGQCACASPNEGTASDCRAPSAEVCAGLMPAKFFDVGTMACVDVAQCAGAATLNPTANACACAAPNIGTASDCRAPSAEVCAAQTPAKFFDVGTTACVDVAECAAPMVLDEATNTCVSADINLRLRIFLEGPLR